MPGISITDLPWPMNAHRVDRLDPEFESKLAASEEDRLRAERLREQAGRHGGDWGARAADLADLIDPDKTKKPGTLASMRFMRDQRIRFTGEELRLVDEDQTGRLARYDIIKPRNACDLDQHIDHDPRLLLQSLRVDVSRVGKGPLNGFLVAAHHDEWNPTTQFFQPHAHIFASGGYIDRLEALRGLKAYKRTNEVRTPIRASHELTALPHALSYVLKSFILERPTLPHGANGAPTRPRSGQRLKEPYHTAWLLWADQWDLADMTLLMGVRIGKDGLVVLKP